MDTFVKILMKIAAFVGSKNEATKEAALKQTELFYRELFTWCTKSERTSEVNNSILVHLGLIKVSCTDSVL